MKLKEEEKSKVESRLDEQSKAHANGANGDGRPHACNGRLGSRVGLADCSSVATGRRATRHNAHRGVCGCAREDRANSVGRGGRLVSGGTVLGRCLGRTSGFGLASL